MRCALNPRHSRNPPAADGIRCPRQEIIAGVWSRTRQAGPTSPHALYPLISLLISLPRRGDGNGRCNIAAGTWANRSRVRTPLRGLSGSGLPKTQRARMMASSP